MKLKHRFVFVRVVLTNAQVAELRASLKEKSVELTEKNDLANAIREVSFMG